MVSACIYRCMYRSQRRWVCASISSKDVCQWWFRITLELNFIPSLVSPSREQLPTLIMEHKYNDHVQCMCVRVCPLDRLMSEYSLSGRHGSAKWDTLISLITCIKKNMCFFNMVETRSWLKTIEDDVKQELSHDCVFSKRKLLLE